MNLQSIRNKLDLVQCLVVDEDWDILLAAETWLAENETFLFELDGYKAVHSCRASRGGGVSIYVRKSIKFREIEKSNKCELINWICISLGEQNLKISVIYKPPSVNNGNFFHYLESIMHTHPKNHLIVGDMNINLLNVSEVTKEYKDLIALNNFKINNSINEECATRVNSLSKSLIDHVLSDYSSKLSCKVKVKENALSDHKLILLNVKTFVQFYKPKVEHEVKSVDYKKFINLFRKKILSLNVTTFQELINLIEECKDKSVYIKKLRVRANNTWINDEVLDLIKKRDKIYRKKINQPENLTIISEFKNIKNKINNKIRALKNRYFQTKWNLAGNNVKKQWAFINSLLKNKKDEVTIDQLIIENNIINNKPDIVNNLNKYFSQVGELIVEDLETEIQQLNEFFSVNEVQNDSFFSMTLTHEGELLEIVKELRINSAPGCDNITVRDVQNLGEYIIPILVRLINETIQRGVFPTELKMSKITPLFKSGDRKCMNNYRPISVVSVFSKILEKLIKKRMLSFIDTRNLLIDEYQYGFIKNSSTLAAVVDFVDYISMALDKQQIVIAVFIDLKKAFDVVSIDILLDKLFKMGFRGILYSLIKTYLYDRKHCIKLDNIVSEWSSNTYGVPQGSVLGPLLYSLYVLNLKLANLRARYFTFADDTVLVYTGTDEITLANLINNDLKNYLKWLFSNKLKINIEKTSYIIFKQKNKSVNNNLNININNIVLEKVSSIKYLGLLIDENLNWSLHLNKISDKVVSMLSALYRSRDYLSNKSKFQIYNAFFLTHFRYLLPVWGMCGEVNFNKAQILQNKILKILFNFDWLTSTNTIYLNLNLNKLRVILEIEQCKLVYKIINNLQKSNINITFYHDVHDHRTRSLNNVYQVPTRTNIGLKNPITDSIKKFNNLPHCIKDLSNYGNFVRKLEDFKNVN